MSPTFRVDLLYVEQLHEQLAQQTSGCSVEQLEQINTRLMDVLWRMRGEWDRSQVAATVMSAFNEVLDDMQRMQRFESVSQKTREQPGTSGIGFHTI
jgi:ATPase family AAA domain-containing protein 2